MKKLLILGLMLMLFSACTKQAPEGDLNAESEVVETAGLGESCEEMICGDGFECNAEKKCVETVVLKDLYCPENRKPVCGKKGDFKNGYLNECEARRHGAVVLYEGFCKKDENVKDDCDARITRIGYCDTTHSGVEFDGKNCVAKSVVSCDAEIPFTTLRKCEELCK